MHPATINFCARPNFLYSAISRMDWTDSCCAGAMKLHVFTTRTSASPARGVISKPERARIPIITSLSTRFFGHPRLTNPTFGIQCGPSGGVETRHSIMEDNGANEQVKAVNGLQFNRLICWVRGGNRGLSAATWTFERWGWDGCRSGRTGKAR